MLKVKVGVDLREEAAWQVARASLVGRASVPVSVEPIRESWVRKIGLYRRTFHIENGVRVDDIDGKPFSTDFAFSRFLTPALAGYEGWALFCDCDFLFRADVAELMRHADPDLAVMCVQHDHRPAESVKMDGQVQQAYPRKNWSSFMLFNCAHPANQRLTPDVVNTEPGRWLHGLGWLKDEEIGAVPQAWNWLEGHSSPAIDPKAVHFTRGGPWMEGYENVRYADEWRVVHDRLGSGRPSLHVPDWEKVA